MKQVVIILFAVISATKLSFAQNINTSEFFPDTNFRRDVERFIGVIRDEPFTAEQAAAATGILSLVRNAEDASGIEFLTGLQGIRCTRASLTQLDVSQNRNLEVLFCSDQSLTELDLSTNDNLLILDCSNNQLQSLILPKNSELIDLRCQHNQLTSLDISNQKQVEIVDCSDNQIQTINLSNTGNIFYINASQNRLTALDTFLGLETLSSLDITKNLLGCDQIENVRVLFDQLGTPKTVQLNEEFTTVQGLNAFEQTLEHACFLFTQDELPMIHTESRQHDYFLHDENEDVVVQGMIYTPPNYSDEGEPFPLLVFHHGSGESGPNLINLDDNGIPEMLTEGDQLPFVILSPQFQPQNNGGLGFYQLFDDAVRDVLETYNIDDSRIYITGLSQGGVFTWLFPLVSEFNAAAIMPIAGGLLFSEPSEFDLELLTQMPIWAFHGTNDNVVTVDEHLFIVSRVAALGADIQFSLVFGADHEQSWKITYDDPTVYSWLLQHSREQQHSSNINNWVLYQ